MMKSLTEIYGIKNEQASPGGASRIISNPDVQQALMDLASTVGNAIEEATQGTIMHDAAGPEIRNVIEDYLHGTVEDIMGS